MPSTLWTHPRRRVKVHLLVCSILFWIIITKRNAVLRWLWLCGVPLFRVLRECVYYFKTTSGLDLLLPEVYDYFVRGHKRVPVTNQCRNFGLKNGGIKHNFWLGVLIKWGVRPPTPKSRGSGAPVPLKLRLCLWRPETCTWPTAVTSTVSRLSNRKGELKLDSIWRPGAVDARKSDCLLLG